MGIMKHVTPMRQRWRICDALFTNLIMKFGPPDLRKPLELAHCTIQATQHCTRPQAQAPVAPATNTSPEYHDHEVTIIQRNGVDIPDLKKVKLEGFTCIPLPAEYSIPCQGIVIVHGPAMPPNPEDAMSYVELWTGFANGHMVLDPFQHLFQAIGTAFQPAVPCLGMAWCAKSPGHMSVPLIRMQSVLSWSLWPPLSRPSTSRVGGTAFGGCCSIVNLHDPPTIEANCKVS
jgi:hypothetical protein